LLWLAIAALLCSSLMIHAFAAEAGAQGKTSNCVSCHARLPERWSKPVTRARTSVHSIASVDCSGCHGGNPEALTLETAHARLDRPPGSPEVARFCGRCHADQQTLYAGSGHARIRGAKAVVNCVDCHGAHDVGNPPELFSLADYCASCHGLEYLPALPADFRVLLQADDRLAIALKSRFEKSLAADDARHARTLHRELGRLVHRGSLDVSRKEAQNLAARMDRLSQKLGFR
jgi:Cytochrome c3